MRPSSLRRSKPPARTSSRRRGTSATPSRANAAVDKSGLEQKLKPAAESIGKVKDYIEKNKAKPASGPRARVGVIGGGLGSGGRHRGDHADDHVLIM
jgi:hypothetical protein